MPHPILSSAIARYFTCIYVIANMLLHHIFMVVGGALAIKIHNDLTNAIHLDGTADLFVHFTPFNSSGFTWLEKKDPYFGIQQFDDLNASSAKLSKPSTRADKRKAVYEVLTAHAKKTQSSTLEQLRTLGFEAESFWISNCILIKRAPKFVFNFIVAFAGTDAGADIVELSPNRIVARIPPIESMLENVSLTDLNIVEKDEDRKIPWNLRMIKADKVWPITKGEGIVVANIDTGVDYDHPQLLASYRGTATGLHKVSHEYNWYDPTRVLSLPTDFHGHGTHTIGIMVGSDVGVAPGARWIAAQGCDSEKCSQERILASAQWVMCPTDVNGTNPRCDLGADIVNNSWGGAVTDDESLTWFSATVEAWLAAGVIPIFANGNSGPACRTASTPGDLEGVLAVGALDQNASLSFFSSRGPGSAKPGHSKYKPDYVAPGQGISSCRAGGGLVPMSGTSMAAPHLSGVVALLLSVLRSWKIDLTFTDIRNLLAKSCNIQILQQPQLGQQACYDVRWDTFPNYQYGYGLVDVEKAVQYTRQAHSE